MSTAGLEHAVVRRSVLTDGSAAYDVELYATGGDIHVATIGAGDKPAADKIAAAINDGAAWVEPTDQE